MTIQIRTLTGEVIKPYVMDLARLRIDIFRDYPYLYEGSLDYEERYLIPYLRSPDTVMVLAMDGDRVVGAASGMPLEIETAEVKRPFLQAGIPVDEVFYFGESLLYKLPGTWHRAPLL